METGIIAVLLLAFLAFFRALRNYRFLRDIPGPPLAGWSDLWCMLARNVPHYGQRLSNLHQRYGKVVRLGPSLVSIADGTLFSQMDQNQLGQVCIESVGILRTLTLVVSYNSTVWNPHSRVRCPDIWLRQFSHIAFDMGIRIWITTVRRGHRPIRQTTCQSHQKIPRPGPNSIPANICDDFYYRAYCGWTVERGTGRLPGGNE